MGQVREAIGVTLSILCSNIRLHLSLAQDHLSDGAYAEVVNLLKDENWVVLLTERASDVVTNIQKTSPSDNLETPTRTVPENDILNGDAQDDVKWMETVLKSRIT